MLRAGQSRGSVVCVNGVMHYKARGGGAMVTLPPMDLKSGFSYTSSINVLGSSVAIYRNMTRRHLYLVKKSVFTAPVHNQCQLEGRRGARKGSSLSSTHIPAICLQHIFPPLKRGEGGCLLYDS